MSNSQYRDYRHIGQAAPTVDHAIPHLTVDTLMVRNKVQSQMLVEGDVDLRAPHTIQLTAPEITLSGTDLRLEGNTVVEWLRTTNELYAPQGVQLSDFHHGYVTGHAAVLGAILTTDQTLPYENESDRPVWTLAPTSLVGGALSKDSSARTIQTTLEGSVSSHLHVSEDHVEWSLQPARSVTPNPTASVVFTPEGEVRIHGDQRVVLETPVTQLMGVEVNEPIVFPQPQAAGWSAPHASELAVADEFTTKLGKRTLWQGWAAAGEPKRARLDVLRDTNDDTNDKTYEAADGASVRMVDTFFQHLEVSLNESVTPAHMATDGLIAVRLTANQRFELWRDNQTWVSIGATDETFQISPDLAWRCMDVRDGKIALAGDAYFLHWWLEGPKRWIHFRGFGPELSYGSTIRHVAFTAAQTCAILAEDTNGATSLRTFSWVTVPSTTVWNLGQDGSVTTSVQSPVLLQVTHKVIDTAKRPHTSTSPVWVWLVQYGANEWWLWVVRGRSEVMSVKQRLPQQHSSVMVRWVQSVDAVTDRFVTADATSVSLWEISTSTITLVWTAEGDRPLAFPLVDNEWMLMSRPRDEWTLFRTNQSVQCSWDGWMANATMATWWKRCLESSTSPRGATLTDGTRIWYTPNQWMHWRYTDAPVVKVQGSMKVSDRLMVSQLEAATNQPSDEVVLFGETPVHTLTLGSAVDTLVIPCRLVVSGSTTVENDTVLNHITSNDTTLQGSTTLSDVVEWQPQSHQQGVQTNQQWTNDTTERMDGSWRQAGGSWRLDEVTAGMYGGPFTHQGEWAEIASLKAPVRQDAEMLLEGPGWYVVGGWMDKNTLGVRSSVEDLLTATMADPIGSYCGLYLEGRGRTLDGSVMVEATLRMWKLGRPGWWRCSLYPTTSTSPLVNVGTVGSMVAIQTTQAMRWSWHAITSETPMTWRFVEDPAQPTTLAMEVWTLDSPTLVVDDMTQQSPSAAASWTQAVTQPNMTQPRSAEWKAINQSEVLGSAQFRRDVNEHAWSLSLGESPSMRMVQTPQHPTNQLQLYGTLSATGAHFVDLPTSNTWEATQSDQLTTKQHVDTAFTTFETTERHWTEDQQLAKRLRMGAVDVSAGETAMWWKEQDQVLATLSTTGSWSVDRVVSTNHAGWRMEAMIPEQWYVLGTLSPVTAKGVWRIQQSGMEVVVRWGGGVEGGTWSVVGSATVDPILSLGLSTTDGQLYCQFALSWDAGASLTFEGWDGHFATSGTAVNPLSFADVVWFTADTRMTGPFTLQSSQLRGLGTAGWEVRAGAGTNEVAMQISKNNGQPLCQVALDGEVRVPGSVRTSQLTVEGAQLGMPFTFPSAGWWSLGVCKLSTFTERMRVVFQGDTTVVFAVRTDRTVNGSFWRSGSESSSVANVATRWVVGSTTNELELCVLVTAPINGRWFLEGCPFTFTLTSLGTTIPSNATLFTNRAIFGCDVESPNVNTLTQAMYAPGFVNLSTNTTLSDTLPSGTVCWLMTGVTSIQVPNRAGRMFYFVNMTGGGVSLQVIGANTASMTVPVGVSSWVVSGTGTLVTLYDSVWSNGLTASGGVTTRQLTVTGTTDGIQTNRMDVSDQLVVTGATGVISTKVTANNVMAETMTITGTNGLWTPRVIVNQVAHLANANGTMPTTDVYFGALTTNLSRGHAEVNMLNTATTIQTASLDAFRFSKATNASSVLDLLKLKNNGDVWMGGTLSGQTGVFGNQVSAARLLVTGTMTAASGVFTSDFVGTTGAFNEQLTTSRLVVSGAMTATTGSFSGDVSVGQQFTTNRASVSTTLTGGVGVFTTSTTTPQLVVSDQTTTQRLLVTGAMTGADVVVNQQLTTNRMLVSGAMTATTGSFSGDVSVDQQFTANRAMITTTFTGNAGVFTTSTTTPQLIVSDQTTTQRLLVTGAMTGADVVVNQQLTTNRMLVSGAMTATTGSFSGNVSVDQQLTANRANVTTTLTGGIGVFTTNVTTPQVVVNDQVTTQRLMVTGAMTGTTGSFSGDVLVGQQFTANRAMITTTFTGNAGVFTTNVTTPQVVATDQTTTNRLLVTGAMTGADVVVNQQLTTNRMLVTGAMTGEDGTFRQSLRVLGSVSADRMTVTGTVTGAVGVFTEQLRTPSVASEQWVGFSSFSPVVIGYRDASNDRTWLLAATFSTYNPFVGNCVKMHFLHSWYNRPMTETVLYLSFGQQQVSPFGPLYANGTLTTVGGDDTSINTLLAAKVLGTVSPTTFQVYVQVNAYRQLAMWCEVQGMNVLFPTSFPAIVATPTSAVFEQSIAPSSLHIDRLRVTSQLQADGGLVLDTNAVSTIRSDQGVVFGVTGNGGQRGIVDIRPDTGFRICDFNGVTVMQTTLEGNTTMAGNLQLPNGGLTTQYIARPTTQTPFQPSTDFRRLGSHLVQTIPTSSAMPSSSVAINVPGLYLVMAQLYLLDYNTNNGSRRFELTLRSTADTTQGFIWSGTDDLSTQVSGIFVVAGNGWIEGATADTITFTTSGSGGGVNGTTSGGKLYVTRIA